MALTVKKVDVWSTEMLDQSGALTTKLEPLARAGVNLDFLMARRQPEKAGLGIAFAVGIKGARGAKAATSAGWQKATDIGVLRVEGPDKAGSCNQVLTRIADAGINLRGASASVIGRRFVIFLAFDSAADAARAAKLVK